LLGGTRPETDQRERGDLLCLDPGQKRRPAQNVGLKCESIGAQVSVGIKAGANTGATLLPRDADPDRITGADGSGQNEEDEERGKEQGVRV